MNSSCQKTREQQQRHKSNKQQQPQQLQPQHQRQQQQQRRQHQRQPSSETQKRQQQKQQNYTRDTLAEAGCNRARHVPSACQRLLQRVADKELERYHYVLSNLLRRALRIDNARKALATLRMEKAAETVQRWIRGVLGRSRAQLMLRHNRIVASRTLRAYLEAMRCRKHLAQRKAEDASLLAGSTFHEMRFMNESMEYANRYRSLHHRDPAFSPGVIEAFQPVGDLLGKQAVVVESPSTTLTATPRSHALSISTTPSRPRSRGRLPEDIRRVQRWMADNHRMAQCLYLGGNFSKNASANASMPQRDACIPLEMSENLPQDSADACRLEVKSQPSVPPLENLPQDSADSCRLEVKSQPSVPRLFLDGVVKVEDGEESQVSGRLPRDRMTTPHNIDDLFDKLKQLSSRSASPRSSRSGCSPRSVNRGCSRQSPKAKGKSSARGWR